MLCLVAGRSWAHSLEHTLRIEFFRDMPDHMLSLLGKQTPDSSKPNKDWDA